MKETELKPFLDMAEDIESDRHECRDKTYFTPEEVRKMTRAEVRANYTAILDSMKKWS